MSDLNEVLEKIIHQECDKYLGNVTKNQVTKIVETLLPEVDKIVAKHVKQHLTMLGQKMVETFQTNTEEK